MPNNSVEKEPKILLLTGAYGRETVMEDWYNGKDFRIVGGPYCSNLDVVAMARDGWTELKFVKLDGTVVGSNKLIHHA